MPTFRVSFTQPSTGESGEILVDAVDAAEARNLAASRGYRSTSVSAVIEAGPAETMQVIRKPMRVRASQEQRGNSVLEIAAGVFLGLSAFALMSVVIRTFVTNWSL